MADLRWRIARRICDRHCTQPVCAIGRDAADADAVMSVLGELSVAEVEELLAAAREREQVTTHA